MPELPNITISIEALERRIVGKSLEIIRIASPFLLRSFDPPINATQGKIVVTLRRIGKKTIWELEDNLFLVFHLMIAGRFHWKRSGAKTGGKVNLAAFDFPNGTLLMTEASTMKRASLHVVRGELALARFDRGNVKRGNELASLEQRAKAIRGVMKIESVSGAGSTVRLTVPIS